ncbi:hypothetical protein [Halopolyspora algeriensis]|uniref:hypothetical protein n=1 Tax=Halopolyspora algeriensis TaxID=1500506 RepID=UPI0013143355|nr:hypothetical protein [Halopolyspora algeriensis]
MARFLPAADYEWGLTGAGGAADSVLGPKAGNHGDVVCSQRGGALSKTMGRP